MRLIGNTASILLVCASLFVAWFAYPALAAKRGNAADYVGVWDMVGVESGEKYRMTLRIDGTNPDGTIILAGEFINKAKPQLSGYIGGTADPSLDGTASGGKMVYYYFQADVDASGTGYFIIGTDDTIAGPFKVDGPGGQKGRWEGKRVSKGAPKPKPAAKGVEIIAEVTGYDAPGGNDKCYLNPGETAAFLGVDAGDPIWKHLQGVGACDGQDFWVYDDGVLKTL